MEFLKNENLTDLTLHFFRIQRQTHHQYFFIIECGAITIFKGRLHFRLPQNLQLLQRPPRTNINEVNRQKVSSWVMSFSSSFAGYKDIHFLCYGLDFGLARKVKRSPFIFGLWQRWIELSLARKVFPSFNHSQAHFLKWDSFLWEIQVAFSQCLESFFKYFFCLPFSVIHGLPRPLFQSEKPPSY